MAAETQVWVDRINEEEMPLLAGAARRLQAVCADDASGLAEISEVILADTAMTTRVLKLANSSTYHTAAKMPVTTVSRAAVILGVQTIAHMCLSMRILDDLLSHSQQQPLLRVLALGLRTAVLSRHLWQLVQPRHGEEVFIAGLLHDLGEAAYFSLGDPDSEILLDRMVAGQEREQAALEVLGTSFGHLGKALAQSWGLGALVGEVLTGSPLSPQARLIGLCHQVAEQTPGLNMTATPTHLMQAMSVLLGVTVATVETALVEAQQRMPEICQDMGVDILLAEMQGRAFSAADPARAGQKVVRRPQDPALQLNILREMTSLEHSPTQFNALVAMTLEGLYRGVGLDRALVAVLSSDARILSARSAVGLYDPMWRDAFRFDLKAGEVPIFQETLLRRQPYWLGEDGPCGKERLGAGGERLFGQHQSTLQAFLAPLILSGRAIGLIYADCPSGALSAEDFSAFKFFVYQLQQSLVLARAGSAQA